VLHTFVHVYSNIIVIDLCKKKIVWDRFNGRKTRKYNALFGSLSALRLLFRK